jgi:hypothetical protein
MLVLPGVEQLGPLPERAVRELTQRYGQTAGSPVGRDHGYLREDVS